jgi:hypothetical protein
VKRFLTVLLTTAALLAVSPGVVRAAPTATPSAGGLSGIGLNPGHYDPNNPATRSYFIPTLSPGATYKDDVQVVNGTDHAVTLIAYPVDGLTSIYSGAVYSNRGEPLQRAGAWVSVSPQPFTVPANSDYNLDFSVAVPADVIPGDHLAGVGVQLATQPTPTPGSAGGPAVTVAVRLVMGVLVKVPGQGAFHLTVSKAVISNQPGINNAYVVVSARNDGRLLGKPLLDVTLAGPGGYHKQLTHQLDTILPTDKVDFPFPWPDTLQVGDYDITVVATGEGQQPFTWNGKFHLGQVLAGAGSPVQIVNVPAESGLVRFLVIAVTVLVVITLLLVLWFVVLLPRRRRRPALSGEELDGVKKRLRSL